MAPSSASPTLTRIVAAARPLARRTAARRAGLATSSTNPPATTTSGAAGAAGAGAHVKIVEVSPRDGLQNEKGVVPAEVKLELIERLHAAGVRCIESGSFVSPKWVPQMGDTPEVFRRLRVHAGTSYPFLVPNARGLESFLALLDERAAAAGQRAGVEVGGLPDEIAVFTAATESFTRANTNCSIAESLQRIEGVARSALDRGLRVRGYVSVVGGCPYEGRVEPRAVADVSDALLQMGCYEVSLGDTVGVATPRQMLDVLHACTRGAPATSFAAHCHDTFGTGLANVVEMVRAGVRTVDAAVGGLGGCPYSPGATGNIDTESVVYALHAEGYSTGVDVTSAARTGEWISRLLGRPNASRAGRATLARLERERERQGEGKGQGEKAPAGAGEKARL